MAAPSIDPAAGDDGSGDGTIGNTYKTTQFALDNTTRDATNGDRFNVKAGSADVLSAALSLTTYGTPTLAAPVMFQGYTAASGDAGIGDIDGGGNAVFNGSTKNGVHFIDMHLHNCGANQIIRANEDCILENCECDTTTTTAFAVHLGIRGIMIGNHIHDFTGGGLVLSDGVIGWNYVVKSHATDIGDALRVSTTGLAIGNIVELTASGTKASGIMLSANGGKTIGNSIWANAGDGFGIQSDGPAAGCSLMNNLVEGFSATGGVGIETGISFQTYLIHNAVFDCDTAYNIQNDEFGRDLDNETLSETPFTDQAGGDYTPVDTGNVKDGAYRTGTYRGLSTTSHFRDKGAVEPTAAAAGGGGGFFRSGIPFGF